MVGLAVCDLNFLTGHELMGWESRGSFPLLFRLLFVLSLQPPLSFPAPPCTEFVSLEIKT